MEKTLKILNLISFIAMIIINGLGEYLPIGYGNTGDISVRYPNLFTPAPITFSIWGIIYIFMAVFIIYQLDFGNTRQHASILVNRIGFWFIISCIMNIGWLISWHNDVIWLSLVFILGLLVSLILISNKFRNLTERKIMTKVSEAGFNIYLGWICAATIANVSVFLIKINWNRFGLSEQIWTIAAIIIGTLLGILFITTKQNYFSAVAIIWAYCGILIKHLSKTGFNGQYPAIVIATAIGIFVILISSSLKSIFAPDVVSDEYQ